MSANRFTTTTTRVVEWGECDPAGIVFYPNFYRWFDDGTQTMMAEHGFGQAEMIEKYNIAGFPLIETHAEFKYPVRWGEQVQLESTVTECSRKTFKVCHKVRVSRESCVEGYEIRFWAGKKFENGGQTIFAMQLPQDFVDYLAKTVKEASR